MDTVWFAILLFCLWWYFIYQRKLAESARQYMQKYCEDHQLQFISIARSRTRLKFDAKRGLYWQNHYGFEFSGDGESRYEGTLVLNGTKVQSVDMPVYRVG